MKILYLPLEFDKWFSAKKLSYSVSVGMVEGFESEHIDHLTIPLMYHRDIWLKQIRSIIGDDKFDQIWIEVVHSTVPPDLLKWVASLAPIRLGIVIESLTIAPNEFEDNPLGSSRRISNFEQKLPFLTHAVVSDSRDLGVLNLPTQMYSIAIPERLVLTPNATSGRGIFFGTAYGDRQEWLPQLKNHLTVNPKSPEDGSRFPLLFEQLMADALCMQVAHPTFFKNWYSIRRSLYSLWISHLHSLPGCCVVNLPHRTSVASGRIIEGMAAGKPVLSPKLHTDNDDLFVDGHNILYYEDIDELKSKISELQYNTILRNSIAENARQNILENYTIESQVKRILEFTCQQ